VAYDQTFRLADGRILSYLDEGDDTATPIFFCHGSPGSRLAAIDLVASAVERGARLIAPDRPGLGRSDLEVGRSMAGWASDVAEMANALGLARFRMLGVSGGGPFALATAWSLPERVERVALLSSPGSFDIPGAMDGMARPQRVMWALARWQPPLLGLMLQRQFAPAQKDPERFTERLIKSTHGPDRTLLEGLDVDERRRFITTPLIEALHQGASGAVEDMRLLRAPWGFGVQDIRVPVHLWHGEEDTVIPVAMGGWLAAMIPDVEAHILPGEGHASTILHYGNAALDAVLGA
jgi:pimeloyl-ACP methyl ester carboxylesterase